MARLPVIVLAEDAPAVCPVVVVNEEAVFALRALGAIRAELAVEATRSCGCGIIVPYISFFSLQLVLKTWSNHGHLAKATALGQVAARSSIWLHETR